MSNSEEKLRLRIKPATPLTEIFLTDSRFRKIPLATNSGEIEIELARGVYQVGFRDGKSVEQKLVVLSPEQASPVVVTATARPLSAVDVEDAAEDAASRDLASLTVRVHDPLDEPASASNRIAGLSLLTQDGAPAAPGQSSVRSNSTDLEFDVAPGYYRVRLETGIRDQVFETPIVVCPGWRIRITCRSRWYGDECRCDFSTAQLRMCSAGGSFHSSFNQRDLEANAIASLVGGRTLSGQAFGSLLRRKFENPMFGFYAGYLLRGSNAGEIDTLAEVVQNLAAMLQLPPGLLHPDLEALRLRLNLLRNEPIDDTLELPLPPMLLASWRTICQVAANSNRIVPKGSLADRISSGLVAAGASMAWSAEQVVAGSSAVQAAAPPPQEDFLARRSTARVARRGIRGISAGHESATTAPPADKTSAILTPEQGVDFVAAALRHDRLRDWFRIAAGLADEPQPGGTPLVSEAERVVAAAIYPIAPNEKFQRTIEKIHFASGSRPSLQTPSTLAQQLRLPLTTVERAVEEFCGKLRLQAQTLGINLQG
ncbi:hypothetical protein [Bradyrhizobium sp.]|uniref:hypothetical protein n=1 Tax=Bradyrhizobium sp. TaxID=376 RepID=UPI002E057F93|nr:hypothetical protein [Bradyrhizobium sp.]